MGKCKDCRWWDKEYLARVGSGRSGMGYEQGFGWCQLHSEPQAQSGFPDSFQLAVFMTALPNALTDEMPAMGWNVKNDIITKQTFGCVQFEAKDNSEQEMKNG